MSYISDFEDRVASLSHASKILGDPTLMNRNGIEFHYDLQDDPDYHSVDGNYRLIPYATAHMDGLLVYTTRSYKYWSECPKIPDGPWTKLIIDTLNALETEYKPKLNALAKKQEKARRREEKAKLKAERAPYEALAKKMGGITK